MSDALQAIFDAVERGQAALLLSGRALDDLTCDEDGKLRPLLEMLRRRLWSQNGAHLITYSLATGLDAALSYLTGSRDRQVIDGWLREQRLTDIPANESETVQVLRGIYRMARVPRNGASWEDGRPARLAFPLQFSEHLIPGCLNNGTQTEEQLVAIEQVRLMASSLALRTSGNLLLFHGRYGLMDELATGALSHICLPQPAGEAKKRFLAAGRSLYNRAVLQDGVTADTVVHLTANTPNTGLEAILRASHLSGLAVTAKQLAAQKSKDISQISEGTLAVMDVSEVEHVELSGRNAAVPQRVLECFAKALMRGDPNMPANVLLAGAPGTGKTHLARLVSRDAGVAAYQMHSPKSQYVGGTERLARLQQEVLRQSSPNIAFIDEISESLPTERGEFDGDSGASRAVHAQLLSALADETRRGKSLLIGTTNCPWRMGAALRGRFLVLPVLHPLREDYVDIVMTIARQITPKPAVDSDDLKLRGAAEIFCQKGANPRQIRQAISSAMLHRGQLDADTFLFAAHDLARNGDLASAVYADLWALKLCSSISLLPWSNDPHGYPFPSHLQGLVDTETGELIVAELDNKIAEYRPHANL